MVSEAVIVELGHSGGEVVQHTVADGTAITKGTLMSGQDLRTAIASATTADGFVGIAAADKKVDDGKTKLGLYTGGGAIFDLTATAGDDIPLQNQVVLSGANLIRAALQDGTEDHLVIGVTRQLITAGTAGEVILK